MQKILHSLFGIVLFTGCPDHELGRFNASPEVVITSHSADFEGLEGYTYLFRAQVSDPDDSADALTVTWRYLDEIVCPAATPNPNGSHECEITIAEIDGDIIVEVVDIDAAGASAIVQVTVIPTEAPTGVIQSPTAAGKYYSNHKVPFLALLADKEDEADALIGTWQSDIDGPLAADGTPDTTGLISSASFLSEGQHFIELKFTDTTGKQGTNSVIIDVGPPNTPPTCAITTPSTGAAGQYGELILFEGEVGDADIPSNQLSVEWTSDKDGLIGTSIPDSAGQVIFPYSALSGDSHVISMTVSDEVNATCVTNMVYKVGMPPEIIITSPMTGTAMEKGQSVVFEATISDTEDIPNAVYLNWNSSLDGVLNTDASDSTGIARFIVSTLSSGHHDITLVGTDTDGLTATAHTTVDINGVPSKPTISLTPTVASTTSNLAVSIVTPSVDPEGTTVSYSYDWYKNGVLSTASTSSVLPASATTRGELWSVTVTPTDGLSFGPTDTAALTIANTAPSVTSASIVPSSPKTLDVLTCTPGTAADADGDTVVFEYSWTINGSTVATTTMVLPASAHKKGDTLSCAITPTDGTDAGTQRTSGTITVQNSAPSIAVITLTPTSATRSDLLTCATSGIQDDDGDTITVTTGWQINGTAITYSGTTLANTYFKKADIVACSGTPNDGTTNGPVVSSTSVTITNAAPVLDSVSLTPTSAATDDDLTCVLGSAVDADGDAITYQYAWLINTVPHSSTGATLNHSAYSRGDSVQCEVTPTDGTTSGTPVRATAVVIQNTKPTVASALVGPSTPRTTDTLVCSPGATTDQDGDSVTLVYTWTVNSTALTVTTSSLSSGYFSAPNVVFCSITPYDGVEYGTPIASSTVTVVNTPPVLSSVNITPSAPTELDTVTCSPGSVFDADGHTITYKTAWTLNGTLLGLTTNSLTGTSFDRGDIIGCTLTPNDGYDDGSSISAATVTVANALPVASTPSMSPTTVYATDTITCHPGTFSDADGDAVTFSYSWTLNGSAVAPTTSTLASTWLSRGDIVRCFVTPYDTFSYGVTVASPDVTISNSAPSIGTVTVSPMTAKAADTLTCTWTGFNDVDGDSDASTVSWTIGGSTVGTGTTLSGVFLGGETVLCTVTPYDGTHTGTPQAGSRTISNTAPVLTSITLIPSVATEASTLTCTPGTATDVDFDTVTFKYAWFVNATLIAPTTSTLNGTYFDRNDSVQCRVTPTDGMDDGAALTSGAVTIQNSPPVMASLTVSPSTAYTDSNLVAHPTATDADAADTVSFNYEWYVNSVKQSVTTSSLDGTSYFDRSDSVYVIVTPTDGIHNGAPMTSSALTIVNSPPSAPSLKMDPEDPLATIDDLHCTIDTPSVDKNGDTVTYTFSWKKNGVTWTGATHTTTRTGDTLLSTYASEGDVWTCWVTPHDGTESGTPGQLDVTVVPCTGRTSTCPALSCKEVLDDGASFGDGNYYLDPTESGTHIIAYCDMTQDGGGWTLIAQGGHGQCGDRVSCGTGCGQLLSTHMRDTDDCGYLSYSDASDFADLSTEVMLTVNTTDTTFGSWDTIAYSTNTKAVDAFSTSSGNWHNGATFDNWTWSTSCTPYYNSGWPNMFHACGYGTGVHWLARHRSMDHSNFSSEVSGTWLR